MMHRRLCFPWLAGWLAFFLVLPLAAATQDLMQQGQRQLDAGELEQAELTFNEVVAQNPDSALGYTRLGGVQLLRQDYRAAIDSFQRAIALDQSNADAFVGMALAYLHMGQYGLARASLQEAQRIAPAKRDEIEKVLAWIDQRSAAPSH
jgi:tetratricopeptide (TPR) repeat protein